jgi:hypothetical protein
MDARRSLVSACCLLSAFFLAGQAGLAEGAGVACVDKAAIERAALSPASAKHFYMECAVVADGKHPFLARLPGERRAAATERLTDKASQTLACSANPRDPARSGLQKKDMIVLTTCKPPRVGEVWPLQ